MAKFSLARSEVDFSKGKIDLAASCQDLIQYILNFTIITQAFEQKNENPSEVLELIGVVLRLDNLASNKNWRLKVMRC